MDAPRLPHHLNREVVRRGGVLCVLRRPGTKFSKVPGYLRVPEYTLLDTDKYAIEHLDSCLITAVHATNISGSGYSCVRVPESTNTDD